MRYLIDGYNLLFYFFDSQETLQKNRDSVIDFFKNLSLEKKNLLLIFDGTKTDKEYISNKLYEHFEVLFTPNGQTADDYILFRVEFSKTPYDYIVVSSDKKLLRACKHLGAKTLTNTAFLKQKSIYKKKSSEKFQDPPSEVERLLKIFEKKSRDL